MHKILIIDDNKVLLNSLTLFLKSEGFIVDSASTAIEGMMKVKADHWDLVLLDYYLEEMTAVDFLGIISEFENYPKVAVFTAQPEEEIELGVLNLDVEDFIRKTEDPKILVNRIRRILNDRRAMVTKLVSVKENLEVNLEFRSVFKNDEEIILTSTEFSILVLFLKNKNKALTREKIYSTVWANKNKFLEELRTIDVHVLNLRKKLGVDSIASRKGVGYVWKEE